MDYDYSRPERSETTMDWNRPEKNKLRSVTTLRWGTFLLISIASIYIAQKSHAKFATKHSENLQKIEVLKQLQAEAQELNIRASQSLSAETALPNLTKKHIGTFAKLNVETDGVRIAITNAPPDAVGRWLAEVRSSTNFRLASAQLSRSGGKLNGELKLTQ
ncbi:hypothetical protein MCEMSHM24_01708 [Comamonadaceae bacterium]